MNIRCLDVIDAVALRGSSDVLIDCVDGGVVPGYALLPHGGLCDTTVFYRAL